MGALLLCYRHFFRRISLLSANSLSDRYVYPTSNSTAVSIIPYPGFEFRERPSIVPPGVVSPLRPINGLSRRRSFDLNEVAHSGQHSISKGSNSLSVLIKVQAITSSFAASLTRILVLMPRSCSRPLRYRANSARNRSL